MKLHTAIVSISVMLGTVSVTSPSVAAPWCNWGTIVTVAEQDWNHTDLLQQLNSFNVPPNMNNTDHNRATAAGHNFCSGFAGGGGPGSTPNGGEVIFDPEGPHTYMHNYNDDYNLSHGLEFKCHKCYAYPPVVPERE